MISRASKACILALCFLSLSIPTKAQIGLGQIDGRINTINTAVPFLRIAPDARSGGMGDVGIGVSPDPNAIFFNPAKLAFVEKDLGISLTYTPWLKELVPDIYLADLSVFKKINDVQTIGAALRFFSLGEIVFTDFQGVGQGNFKPNEFALDVAYARTLTDFFSASLALKFIYSNLASGQLVNGDEITAGTGVAADVSVFFRNPDIKVSGKKAEINAGVNISNLGTKISYTNSAENKDFIPTNLGVGAGLTIDFDEYNSLTIATDLNKLLVPTPDTLDEDNNQIYDYKEQSSVSGIFSSFNDAPDGFSEELKEWMIGIGVEYWYSQQFAVRAGYFNEAATKGNRKFFTMGLGVKYNVFGLNFSYLVSTSGQRNPLNNTLRFSLLFDFDALKSNTEEETE